MTVDYNRLAARFDERYQHLTHSGIHSQLLELIDRPGLHVLEVGCGTGHWLAALSGHAACLLGADPSSAMLDKAHRQAPAARLVCAPAERLPFSCNSMDLIFCVNAFHHFSDPKRFLRNASSLLRKAGRLAIFGLDPHDPEAKWYFYEYFPSLKEIDLQRFVPHNEIAIPQVILGNSFIDSCSRADSADQIAFRLQLFVNSDYGPAGDQIFGGQRARAGDAGPTAQPSFEVAHRNSSHSQYERGTFFSRALKAIPSSRGGLFILNIMDLIRVLPDDVVSTHENAAELPWAS